MATRFTLLLLLGILIAAPAQAQPVVQVDLAGGYAYSRGPGGPGLDAAVGLRWGRVLTHLHVAAVAFQPEVGHSLGTQPGRTDYSVGVDVNVVQPLHRAVALVGGAGLRATWYDGHEPSTGAVVGLTGYFPYLTGGVAVGPAGGVNVLASVEVEGILRYTRLGRAMLGVSVPILRFGTD